MQPSQQFSWQPKLVGCKKKQELFFIETTEGTIRKRALTAEAQAMDRAERPKRKAKKEVMVVVGVASPNAAS